MSLPALFLLLLHHSAWHIVVVLYLKCHPTHLEQDEYHHMRLLHYFVNHAASIETCFQPTEITRRQEKKQSTVVSLEAIREYNFSLEKEK